jgi:hypothetical protein
VRFLIFGTSLRGPGVETDSVNYLAAADSLARGAGYLGWDGQVLPWFPPGYPIVIALGKLLTGLSAAQVAEGVDIVLFAGLVMATYLLAGRVISNSVLRLLVTAFVAASPIALHAYSWVLSETLFNFLCVLALVVVCSVIQTRPISFTRYRAALALLAAIAAFAALTRITGVVLVLSLALALMVFGSPGKRLIARLVESLGFGLVALAPLAAWDIFLRVQTGSWTFGNRSPSNVGLGSDILTAAQTVAGWPSRPSVAFPGAGWLDLVVAAVVVVALGIGLAQVVRTPRIHLRKIAPVLIFCVAYPAFMIAISSRVFVVGALDDRYLSPFLAPLVVLVGFVIELAWMRARGSRRLGRVLAVAMMGALGVSLVSSMVLSERASVQAHATGVGGATSADWTDMSILRTAGNLPSGYDGQLLSNLPEMMSYSTGRPYQYPPFRADGEPVALEQQVKDQGPAYLVLLSTEDDPELYNSDELAQWFTVRVLDSSLDGQVLELTDLK